MTPEHLGEAGQALWTSVSAALPEGFELDEREAAQLDLAARQADDLARLEALIEEEGPASIGSQGQRIVHPAIPEARQARIAISRLLGELDLAPDQAESPSTAASRRASKAARARWGTR
jgi:phage terminase small subunit